MRERAIVFGFEQFKKSKIFKNLNMRQAAWSYIVYSEHESGWFENGVYRLEQTVDCDKRECNFSSLGRGWEVGFEGESVWRVEGGRGYRTQSAFRMNLV